MKPFRGITSEQVHEKMKVLAELYTVTEEDWTLFLSADLTEPTAPTAWVAPWHDRGYMRYRADRGDILTAMYVAMCLAEKELLKQEGEVQGDLPVTTDMKYRRLDDPARAQE